MPETCYVYHRGTALRGIATNICDHLYQGYDRTEVPYNDAARAVLGGTTMLGVFDLQDGVLVFRDATPPDQTA